MRNSNPDPCVLTNSNLFQPNAEMSTGCPNNAAMCKSVEKSHPGLNEDISPHSIGKLKGQPSFNDFVDEEVKLLKCAQELTHLYLGVYQQ